MSRKIRFFAIPEVVVAEVAPVLNKKGFNLSPMRYLGPGAPIELDTVETFEVVGTTPGRGVWRVSHTPNFDELPPGRYTFEIVVGDDPKPEKD